MSLLSPTKLLLLFNFFNVGIRYSIFFTLPPVVRSTMTAISGGFWTSVLFNKHVPIPKPIIGHTNSSGFFSIQFLLTIALILQLLQSPSNSPVSSRLTAIKACSREPTGKLSFPLSSRINTITSLICCLEQWCQFQKPPIEGWCCLEQQEHWLLLL